MKTSGIYLIALVAKIADGAAVESEFCLKKFEPRLTDCRLTFDYQYTSRGQRTLHRFAAEYLQ